MTTDHAAEARRWLESEKTSSFVDRDARLARAQVHATLALAEQQRISNLIAVANYIRAHDIDLPDTLDQIEDTALGTLGLDGGDQ